MGHFRSPSLPGSPGRVECGGVLLEEGGELLDGRRRVGGPLCHAGHQVVLLPAEEGPPLHGEDDLGVQVLDGGERELGDDGVVQERVPAVRQLHQREVARELDPAVHRHQVVRLEE